MRRIILALLLAVGTLATAPVARAAAPDHQDRAAVRVYDYDLGDDVFTVRGFTGSDGAAAERLAPLELIGRVYVPDHAAGERLPLVVLAHGLFWTCADDATGRTRQDWPCRGSFTGIHSERGYDYLGRTLAARGVVVVSVSANGVNAGALGGLADRARGELVYEHLRLWQRLVEHGTGRLAGALTDARTGRPAAPDLRRSIDFTDVGLLGHSRGGRGMMWAAADAQLDRVPRGVRFRAVMGLAPAEPAFLDHRARRFKVSHLPVLTWLGGCDATGDDSYNRLARRGGNPVSLAITVHGANHNNLNSRWAARSGLPGSTDDASHPRGRPDQCRATADPTQLQDTLGYHAEQRVAATYVEAFFARYLQGDRSYDDVLSGQETPAAGLTQVDVRRY